MKNALVVDDTKSIRILLSKCLEYEGYSVTTARKGKEAVELLQVEKYDVVFLDIKMPFMSGTEVLKWMVQEGIKTPVVIMTAYATVKNAVECTRMGAVAYLQKPFTMDKFRKLMRDVEGKISREILQKGNTNLGERDEEHDSLQAARRELESGSPQSAFLHLKEALSKDPANPEAYLLLSKVYFLTGDYENGGKFLTAYKVFSRTLK